MNTASISPLEAQILLHYHLEPTDYADGNFGRGETRAAIDHLRTDLQMLETDSTNRQRTYRLTERGLVHVQAMCQVALPVMVMERLPSVRANFRTFCDRYRTVRK